jgi:RND family efflux transporter MFP subunit
MKALPALTLVAALSLAACSPPPPPPAPPLTVKTLVASAAGAADGRRYSGEVRARHELPLSFRVGGKLLERPAELGAHVAAGQVVARLDPADLAHQADQAAAQLAFAEDDARRFRDLRAKNFVSAAALDAKETALRAARAQAGLAANQKGYTTLTADRAGLIAELLAEPGQVLAAGQPVVTLAVDGEREVRIALPEAERGSAKPGDAVTISIWATGAEFRGRIRELSAVADPATRSFLARVAIENPDDRLSLGMSAQVRFQAATTEAIQLPLTALSQQGEQAAVWQVRDDNTVTRVPVKVARYSDGGAVIESGLKGGETLVAAGVYRLTEGEKVRPVK